MPSVEKPGSPTLLNVVHDYLQDHTWIDLLKLILINFIRELSFYDIYSFIITIVMYRLARSQTRRELSNIDSDSCRKDVVRIVDFRGGITMDLHKSIWRIVFIFAAIPRFEGGWFENKTAITKVVLIAFFTVVLVSTWVKDNVHVSGGAERKKEKPEKDEGEKLGSL